MAHDEPAGTEIVENVGLAGYGSGVLMDGRVLMSIALGVMCLTLSCGDGRGTNSHESPAMPGPSDPAFGKVGNVLVSDMPANKDAILDEIWIGFNGPAEWAQLVAFDNPHRKGVFVGGRVVVDATQPAGFRFDPDTTGAGEVVVPETVTTLDSIRGDPTAFADNQRFGRWNVRAELIRIVPAVQ